MIPAVYAYCIFQWEERMILPLPFLKRSWCRNLNSILAYSGKSLIAVEHMNQPEPMNILFWNRNGCVRTPAGLESCLNEVYMAAGICMLNGLQRFCWDVKGMMVEQYHSLTNSLYLINISLPFTKRASYPFPNGCYKIPAQDFTPQYLITACQIQATGCDRAPRSLTRT